MIAPEVAQPAPASDWFKTMRPAHQEAGEQDTGQGH
jgi:hypothetical protein